MRKVLVAGIILTDVANTAANVVNAFAATERWSVDQRWLALGAGAVPPASHRVHINRVEGRLPKFPLLNRLFSSTALETYDYVVICDDDVHLPPGFVDSYLALVERYEFDLCQPARTSDSYIDHPFVERLNGIDARWTRFVEIGPVISMSRRAVRQLIPFDETSPMGWGYDLVWPAVMEAHGCKLGIVDAVPITHSLRAPVQHYQWDEADGQMRAFLDVRAHLSFDEACVIRESYVEGVLE